MCTYSVYVEQKSQAASHGTLNAAMKSTEGNSERSTSRPRCLILRQTQEGDRRCQCYAEFNLIAVTTPPHLPRKDKGHSSYDSLGVYAKFYNYLQVM